MKKYDIIRRKFQSRERIIATNVVLLDSPPMLELINEPYLDCVVFDMEHGCFNNERLIPNLQVCRLIDLPAIVRIPEASAHHITRCMDLGASGIMIPRTETSEQVKLAIDSMFFQPIGKKGRGGYCQLREGEQIADYQKNRYLILQIETVAGVNNLDAILSEYREQIAAIVIGPYDLSISLGICRQFENPLYLDAVDRIFEICKTHQISYGIFCDGKQQAEHWRKNGANFLWICTDEQLIRAGMRAEIAPLI